MIYYKIFSRISGGGRVFLSFLNWHWIVYLIITRKVFIWRRLLVWPSSIWWSPLTSCVITRSNMKPWQHNFESFKISNVFQSSGAVLQRASWDNEIMDCCLTASCRYLNRCWFIISGVLRHSLDGILRIAFSITRFPFKIKETSVRDQCDYTSLPE